MNSSDWRWFEEEEPPEFQLCVVAGLPGKNRINYGVATWTGTSFTWWAQGGSIIDKEVKLWLPIERPPSMKRPDQQFVLVGADDLADMRIRLFLLESQVHELKMGYYRHE